MHPSLVPHVLVPAACGPCGPSEFENSRGCVRPECLVHFVLTPLEPLGIPCRNASCVHVPHVEIFLHNSIDETSFDKGDVEA